MKTPLLEKTENHCPTVALVQLGQRAIDLAQGGSLESAASVRRNICRATNSRNASSLRSLA